MLVYCNVAFEDVTYEQGEAPEYSRQQWEVVKNDLGLDFPNLPYFIHKDVRITETLAIMKYIAAKWEPLLLGKTSDDIGTVEMVAGVLCTIKNDVTMPCYQTDNRERLAQTATKKIAPIAEHLRKDDKEYLVGSYVTYVDFILMEQLELIMFITEDRLAVEHPVLEAYLLRMKSLPQLHEYMANNEDLKVRPFNNKVAKINNYEEIKREIELDDLEHAVDDAIEGKIETPAESSEQ